MTCTHLSFARRVRALRASLPIAVLASLCLPPPAAAQQATLDQAKALVTKCRAQLREQGCARTFKEVTEGRACRVDGFKELYVYMYDENLNNLAHGGNPRLPGKNLKDMKDTKGRYLNQDLLKAAKAGGGAVAFDFLNPNTGQVDPKEGWAEMETRTDCGPVMVGSGVYRPAGR